jgi:RNA polymerase sigma factor (sigma-70 family)
MTLTRQQMDELLTQHEPMAWWIARRVMGADACPDDLEDCAAEVRLQFVRSARQYDPTRGARFGTYAFRLAHHYARRWKHRQRKRGVHVPVHLNGRGGPRVIDLDAAGSGCCLRTAQSAGNDTATIWAALARVLTTKQLEVLRMRYLGGMTLRAIADQHGCSRANIQCLISAALDRARRLAPGLAQYLE